MKWFRTAVLIAVPLLITLLVAISSGRISNDAAVALHELDAGRELLTETRLAQDQVAAVRFNSETGSPAFISGTITPPAGANPLESSQSFFEANKDLYRMSDPATELTLKRETDDELGMSHVHLSQQYQGLPVYAAEVSVHFSRDGKIVSVNGNYVPDIAVNPTPGITIDDAIKSAQADLGYDAPSSSRELPLLTVFAPPGGAPQLTWEITLASDDRALRMAYFVDAHTGEIAAKYDLLETARNRLTYTAENGTDLPGTLLISEGGSSTDPVVQAAHDNAGLTYDYYQNTFGLDSFDGAGATLISTAHFDFAYNNAFWNGHQMVYGDGDGYNFGPFSQASDVVAHELTHAVTEYSADLVYVLQSGALNESYSDVFGAMVDRDDWLMGEEIYTPGTPGDALRSLSNPAAYGDPEHMSDFVQTYYDNGGVHTNSGIPNKAAYNVATAIGKAKMEQIWYRTLTLYLNAGSQFLDARDASVQAAVDLYGAGSAEATATANGFAAVGLDDTQPTEISGVVTNGAGEPIPDIYVIAYHSNGQGGWNPATNSSTDASGVYTLRGLAGGDYRVEFTDMSGGYFGEFYNDKPSFDSADTIAVAPGTAVTGKNAVLSRGGSISGTVTDEAGAPVAGVQVWSCKQNAGGGCTWYSYTQTNADGSYTLGGLEGGDYKVEFGYESNYIVQYYDNKPDMGTADPISVGPGAQITGKDAVLVARGSGGSISGTVTNGAGPLESIYVGVHEPDGNGGWVGAGSTVTNADGTYTLSSLAAGDYRIEFYDFNGIYVREYYNDKVNIDIADTVSVGPGAQITGKDAVLTAGGGISGTVTNGTVPLEGITVFAYPPDDQGSVASAITGADGTYTLGSLPIGDYKLQFYPQCLPWIPASCDNSDYISEFYDDKPDFQSADIISIGPGTTVTGADAVLGLLDTTAPNITNIKPSGTITTTTATVRADFSDSGSGINSDTGAVYLDGIAMTGCTKTAANISCPATGLALAHHTIAVSVSDYAGNVGTGTGAFDVTEPPITRTYDFTWYDNVGADNWILMSNPAGSGKDLNFDLTVAGEKRDLAPFALQSASCPGGQCASGQVPPGMTLYPRFAGVMGGPVSVRSLGGDKAIVSQRSVWAGGSLEEVLGIDAERRSSHFYWTWYDQLSAGMINWVLVANPNEAPVYFEITIHGAPAGQGSSGVIGPGESAIPTFASQMGGPVEVRAWTNSGKGTPAEVMASQRVLSNGGSAFNEIPGIPAEELSDSYMWTWYDNIGGQNWVLVANTNPMTIYYQIELNGGCNLPGDLPADKACETGSIAAGQNVTSMLAGKRGGPLEVRTWADVQHNTPAASIASQRMLWGPSFEEVPGYPTAALASDYHWTWYDQQTAGVTNWVLVANPNDTPVYYEITIGGEPAGPGSSGTIQPGQNVIPTFDTRMGGPVEVRAWTDPGKGTPAEVMASQRVLWKGYFNEVLGTVLE
jgi:thermolysin